LKLRLDFFSLSTINSRKTHLNSRALIFMRTHQKFAVVHSHNISCQRKTYAITFIISGIGSTEKRIVDFVHFRFRDTDSVVFYDDVKISICCSDRNFYLLMIRIFAAVVDDIRNRQVKKLLISLNFQFFSDYREAY